jgi:hypothetical protein
MKAILQEVGRQTGSERTSESLIEEYEGGLRLAREEFNSHPAVLALFHRPMEAIDMETFLISFTVLGVGMTEPVEGWIRRAAVRCGELGLAKLAKALDGHAHQEADHHLLMLADASRLVDRWNKTRKPELSVPTLREGAPTPGVGAYQRLHEDVIAGPTPYGQLAIEYEIEMLSVTYGPRLIERCTGLLGNEIVEGLSFLRDHVELDVGHTHFNRIQLGRLLAEHPDFLPGLIDAGSKALRAYASFLGDCLELLRGIEE